MRKKLQILSTIFSILLIVPLVVSCTLNFNYLANRVSDPKVLNTIIKDPITSWSSGITNLESDSKIVTNLVGTLVANDKYNRLFGDIAEQKDKLQENVGQHNREFTEWTYKISPDAKWFDYQGNFIRNIKASDMVNTAKYVLYPNNMSLVYSLFTEFIDGAKEIRKYFTDTKPTTSNYWDDPIFNKLGIIADDEKNEVTFRLSRPAYFFETLLTHLAFCPMPEIALKLGYNYGKKHTNIWYSGAYLVKDYDSTSRIVLQKNPHYRFAKLTKIETVNFILLQSSDVSRQRVLFESGDIDEFDVNQNDTYGWKRYVGLVPSNPAFAGAYSTVNPEATSYDLWFNFANTNIFNTGTDAQSKQKKADALKASRALQYRKIRQYIITHLDRSKIIKYYSEVLDKDPTKSSMLRNNMVSPKFAYDNNGKDYISYFQEEYQKGFNIDDINTAKYQLRDGNDALLNNKKILNNQSSQEVLDDIRKWLQENIGQDYVTLRLITNPTQSPLNKYIANAIDSFSQNGVIRIVADTAKDNQDFNSRMYTKSDFDLAIQGWGPDYADPYSYLYVSTIEGNMSIFTGTERLLEGLKLQNGLAPRYQDLNLNNPYWNALDTTAREELYNDLRDYNNLIKEGDAFGKYQNLQQRFAKFAEAEFNIIYKSALFIPLNVKNGSWQVKVSYIIPRTTSNISYGSSKNKLWGAEKSAYLLTKDERHMIEAKYQEDLELIKCNHAALREDY